MGFWHCVLLLYYCIFVVFTNFASEFYNFVWILYGLNVYTIFLRWLIKFLGRFKKTIWLMMKSRARFQVSQCIKCNSTTTLTVLLIQLISRSRSRINGSSVVATQLARANWSTTYRIAWNWPFLYLDLVMFLLDHVSHLLESSWFYFGWAYSHPQWWIFHNIELFGIFYQRWDITTVLFLDSNRFDICSIV